MAKIKEPSVDVSQSFQLGDGFYPFKETTVVDSVPRNLKDLNGEVIPGTGLTVKVRGCYALIDGSYVLDGDKTIIDTISFTTLPVSIGTSYVVLGFRDATKSHKIGKLSISNLAPAVDSGVLLVAKLIIPESTTQVTSEMIDNSVKHYIDNLEDQNSKMTDLISWALENDAYVQFWPLDTDVNEYTGSHDTPVEIEIRVTNGVGVKSIMNSVSTVVVTATGGTAPTINGSSSPVTITFAKGLAAITVLDTAAGVVNLALSDSTHPSVGLNSDDTATVTLS